jgi:pyridoxine 5-phosphate synthase
VVLRNVVDELHDDDSLADTGTAEEANLATLGVGGQQVNDLDAGDQNLVGVTHVLQGGGLVVDGQEAALSDCVATLHGHGMRVSLFIDAEEAQIDAAVRVGAPVIELHTGAYAEAKGPAQAREFARLQAGARYAAQLGLVVNAGHGLHYHNVQPVAAIPEIVELNIGHAIIARAVFDGLPAAVREMRRLMIEARSGVGAR